MASSKHLPGRFKSAWVDLAVWTLILVVVVGASETLARSAFGIPKPAGSHPRDELSLVAYGFAALCANLYLAVSAAKGRSVGKALLGLRLVVADDDAKPGLARGLVRSSLQALPYMGALMVLTGAHDSFAGTRIVHAEQHRVEHFGQECETPHEGSRVSQWKVALAIVVHLFAALVYMIVGAL